jgi:hypothetical protein
VVNPVQYLGPWWQELECNKEELTECRNLIFVQVELTQSLQAAPQC